MAHKMITAMMLLFTTFAFAKLDFSIKDSFLPTDKVEIEFTNGLNVTLNKDNTYLVEKFENLSNGESSPVIHLKNAQFDPLDIQHLDNRFEKGLHIVQFKTKTLPEYLTILKQMGAEISYHVPDQARIIDLNEDITEEIKNLPFVRSLSPFYANYKLGQNVSLNNFVNEINEYTFQIVKNSKEKVFKTIKNLGGIVTHEGKNTPVFKAKLTTDQMEKIVSNSSILWIQRSGKIEEDMNNARIQGGIEKLKDKSTGNVLFSGVGIRGHILEGIYADHQDFAAKETRQAPIAVDDPASASHGQATFGIVFGDGAGDKDATGILPDGQGYYTHYNKIYSKKASRFDLVKKLIDEHKVLFQTASWGHSRTTQYDAVSAEMDHIIFNLDIPITQSQSNSGTQMSRPQAWAKNIISVGAVYHYDNTDPSDDKWNRGASIGPAQDGRIKPDLCAYYDKIRTTGYNNGYTSFGGTSGATPIVAGHVGAAIEMWGRGIFGNPIKTKQTKIQEQTKQDSLSDVYFLNRPHATTVKALLINTANDYPFEGEDHENTRVHQGWGFPALDNLYNERQNLMIINEDQVLNNLEAASYQVEVGENETQLKATMVYREPEAAVSASKQLINDLNLKVTSPSGVVYWGNNGLLEGNFSTPEGTPNDLDNVENVIIQNPEVGTWTVEVIAENINTDAHLETEEIDSVYALVVGHK